MNQPPVYPSFREALAFWLKLGFISFGGPAGQISIMHAYLVEKKKWISDSRFLHAMNYCMLLPGPEAQQLATYTGWLMHGIRGGLAAGLLFILPSAVMLWVLSLIYVTYGTIPVITAMFSFLKPAVVAIVLTALIKIGKKSLTSPIHYVVACIAFAMIYFFNISFPLIILFALITGAVMSRIKNVSKSPNHLANQQHDADESTYLINQTTLMYSNGFSSKVFSMLLPVFFLLWLAPLAILYAGNHFHFAFYQQLSLFFTKAAFTSFGGAYAVLPYVAQMSVHTFGWLTPYQMIDGLALGETTPGPLIMVLSFVGFMAGYNFSDGNIGLATLGLALTTFYTFLPSFFFIFAGAPIIERTQSNAYLKSVIMYVSAAVTGVILHLGFFFGKAVIMPSPPVILWLPLTWLGISFVFLQFFKVNMIGWIGVSLAIGIITFILQGL